jgi:thiol-disulfide isomerase/thioredoxin
VLRRVLGVAWAAYAGHDEEREGDAPASAELARKVLAEVEPTDPLWSMDASGLHAAVEAAGASESLIAYEDAAVEEHPDPNVGGSILLARLQAAGESRDMDAARAAKKSLKHERFAKTQAARSMIWYDPERPLAKGNKIPDIELSSLDGKRTFKPSQFEGKVLVLDFWATWCGPCKADMPVMHSTYATVNGKKARKDAKYRKIKNPEVEFLSISFDASPDDPKRYHAEEWPMPWHQAYASPEDAQKLREELGIVGIPTLVVVDPSGTIVQSTPFLRGDTLGAMLGEVLGKAADAKEK